MRKIQEFTYDWPPDALLVHALRRHQRALGPRAVPGLAPARSGAVAGVLYRDFSRGRDDALIVVVAPTAERGRYEEPRCRCDAADGGADARARRRARAPARAPDRRAARLRSRRTRRASRPRSPRSRATRTSTRAAGRSSSDRQRRAAGCSSRASPTAGRGSRDLKDVLDGRYVSSTGHGTRPRRRAAPDGRFAIESAPGAAPRSIVGKRSAGGRCA